MTGKRLPLLFYTSPAILLIIFYYWPKAPKSNHSFTRILAADIRAIPLDTFFIPPGEVVDGLAVDQDNLWTNGRHFLSRKGISSKIKAEYIAGTKFGRDAGSIVNFYVNRDTAFYLEANQKVIVQLPGRHDKKDTFNFNFPVTYFLKLSGSNMLFMENLQGNGAVRLHAIDFSRNHSSVDDTVFSNERGAGMKYSGKWFATADQTKGFFVPFQGDQVLCFDDHGEVKYSFKPVDHQNQKMEVKQEGTRFYLNPNTTTLRLGASATGQTLYISSYVYSNSQDRELFNNNLTIDTYRTENGQYLNSFYLPDYQGVSAADFVVTENSLLFALYNNSIIKYRLTKIPGHEEQYP